MAVKETIFSNVSKVLLLFLGDISMVDRCPIQKVFPALQLCGFKKKNPWDHKSMIFTYLKNPNGLE